MKNLSKSIKDALINQRHYNFSFDRSSLHSKYDYVRVKDIAEAQTGFPFSKTYFTDDNSDNAMPLIRIRDLKNNVTNFLYRTI